jgi:hypothetical protein
MTENNHEQTDYVMRTTLMNTRTYLDVAALEHDDLSIISIVFHTHITPHLLNHPPHTGPLSFAPHRIRISHE